MAFSLIAALCLWACDDGRTPQLATLAMEGWIDSGGYPVVILTQTLAPSTSPTDVAEAIVRWGKVSITDGRDTVVMTGGVDGRVFPPYSYRSFAMRGEVGRTYTVIAEYNGMRAVATSRILPPPRIDAVTFDREADGSYTGRVAFTAPDTEQTCHYVVYTRNLATEGRHYPAMLGTAVTHGAGARCEVPLFRGRHIDAADALAPAFSAGDTVDVMVARVTDDVYRFWQGYQDAVYFGNNLFVSGGNGAAGNVEGGYGVFSGRGVGRRTVVVGGSDTSASLDNTD